MDVGYNITFREQFLYFYCNLSNYNILLSPNQNKG